MSETLGASLARLQALDPASAERVSQAIERLARVADALAWARDRLPRLIAAGTATGVLEVVVDEAKLATDAPEVWALTWTGDLLKGQASFRALAGVSADGETPRGADGELLAPDGLSRSIVGRAVREGRPAWSDDAADDARFSGAQSVQALALRSVGCVPIGKRGALYLYDPSTPGRFGADARARLAALCELASPFLDAPEAPRRTRAPAIPGLVGEHPAMLAVFDAIRAFAPMPWPALILGETGTGKEAVARALHEVTARRGRPFVAVNCGAIPDDLAESTLFGHEKGAFTGADRRKEGMIERVHGGTLFLDEVGELSARVQVKLLRLLQEGTYERVGGERELRFDGRVVAATHRDVDDPGVRGSFREDLYHRLSACVLRVPPLRDRRGDIPAIAEALLARSLAELPGAHVDGFDPEAARWLAVQPWPGNVRELHNAVRGGLARAIARGSSVIAAADLGTTRPVARAATPANAQFPVDLLAATDRYQRELVESAIAAAAGNKSQAAQLLGVSRQWLHRLVARWEGGV
jgi:Nif-specific regulatory protein